MKKRFAMMCSAFVMGAALLAACGGGAPAPTATPTGPKVAPEAQKFVALKGDPAAGKTKFESTCVSCHGADAKGLPNLGKDLTASTFLKGLPDAEAILFVTKGRPASDPANTTKVDMPPRGGNPALKDQDIADIISYLRTLEK